MNYRLLIICSAIFLSACVKNINVTSPQARLNYLNNMQKWQAKGRVAIRSESEGHVASIVWQQNDADYDIFLTNPLASQSLHVTPETIQDSYLLDLPINHLRYWVKGMPSPHAEIAEAEYDQQHKLISLQQEGWHIKYISYSAYPPIMLPTSINADKNEINIKLIINCWDK